MSDESQTPADYPHWLVLWFVISAVFALASTIIAPIVHHFVPDLWKPAVWLAPAIGWAGVAGSLLKGEDLERGTQL